MSDPAHFYSSFHSADALLPRSGSIWAERGHRAVRVGKHQVRIGLVIFWTIIAALLLARIVLVDSDLSQQTMTGAQSTPASQPAPATK